MNRMFLVLGMLAVLSVSLAGCLVPANVQQILSITDAAYPQELDLDSAGVRIDRAARMLDWSTEILSAGDIIAFKRKGSSQHSAQVRILFDTDSYSITYHNSQHLDYNGTRIHKLYNRWVRDLSLAVDTELAL